MNRSFSIVDAIRTSAYETKHIDTMTIHFDLFVLRSTRECECVYIVTIGKYYKHTLLNNIEDISKTGEKSESYLTAYTTKNTVCVKDVTYTISRKYMMEFFSLGETDITFMFMEIF